MKKLSFTIVTIFAILLSIASPAMAYTPAPDGPLTAPIKQIIPPKIQSDAFYPWPENWPPLLIVPSVMSGTIISVSTTDAYVEEKNEMQVIRDRAYPIRIRGNPTIRAIADVVRVTPRITVTRALITIEQGAEKKIGRIVAYEQTTIYDGDNQPISVLELKPGYTITAIGSRFKGSTGLMFARAVHLIPLTPFGQ